ncbi:ABC transporter ATP-binding protein [Methanolapillus ohkumae]|uniref:Vitamin B12 import ATP-binding protein BtuD n=1 Tax=Methanolapillus ohkumae TaxID=3028298 RepID=A0AA96V5U3_9EURY|nr:Vitamin B12 import ATP-binding protein BtuD [Methanosarcinaceae archaeon Am2]
MNNVSNTIPNNILELNNVTKHFTGFSLQNVSFSLPEGFIMGFIGKNGAGKTTTIQSILNMLPLDSGAISVFGKDHLADEPEIKSKIGIVMDQSFYLEEWKITDVEKALSPFYEKWDSGLFSSLLSQFGLDKKKKVKSLSRGMRMKLMIVVALSHGAGLLILDEPTSGLDAVSRSELMEILKNFVMDEKKGVLFSTHNTQDLEKIADYITFINDGRIIYSDTKDNLLEKYVLVKGKQNTLSDDQKKKIIGYRDYNFGFDGLTDVNDLKFLPASVVVEPATLDDIVIRFNIGGDFIEKNIRNKTKNDTGNIVENNVEKKEKGV